MQRSAWIYSASIDGIVMMFPLWLIPILVVCDAIDRTWTGALLDRVLLLAALSLWLAHRFASLSLLVTVPAYRRVVSRAPIRFVAVPLLLTCAVFAWFLLPDAWLPIP